MSDVSIMLAAKDPFTWVQEQLEELLIDSAALRQELKVLFHNEQSGNQQDADQPNIRVVPTGHPKFNPFTTSDGTDGLSTTYDVEIRSGDPDPVRLNRIIWALFKTLHGMADAINDLPFVQSVRATTVKTGVDQKTLSTGTEQWAAVVQLEVMFAFDSEDL